MPFLNSAYNLIRGRWGSIVCLALLQIAYGSCVQAQSRQPEWSGRPYQYLIIDQDLRVVLEEFGHNNKVRLVLSPAVQGRVRGNVPNATARVFLDAVTRSFGLDWYFDGATIFVTPGSESRTKLVDMQGQSFDEMFAKVKLTDAYDDRYQVRPGPSPKVASVSGPPRFVEAMTDAIAALAPVVTQLPDKPFVVTVFHGGGGVGEHIVFPPLRR